jgi:hypothetical protein
MITLVGTAHPTVIATGARSQLELTPKIRSKAMPYLLSLLTAEFSEEESPQLLCYYINVTDETQIVHVMNESKCYLESVVLPQERILFTALPESHLKIYSSSIYDPVIEKISCKLLNINRNKNY